MSAIQLPTLDDIKQFCAIAGMAESRFAREAFHDAAAMHNMNKGVYSLTPRRSRRALLYMRLELQRRKKAAEQLAGLDFLQ